MSQIFPILEQLSSSRSRLHKEAVLADNKENVLFRRVLQYALNGLMPFYMRAAPEYTPAISESDATVTLDDFLDVLDLLSARVVTGHAARDLVVENLSKMAPGDADVGARVLAKDLRCGISHKTVNKILGKDFVSEYPVLLAEKKSDKYIAENITWPAFCQNKFDGMRSNAVLDTDGAVLWFTRNGKTLSFHNVLDCSVTQFITHTGRSSGMLDGELVVLDENGNVLPRKTGNGILNKAIKGTISEEEASRIRFHVWDFVELSDYTMRRGETPYITRLNELAKMAEADVHGITVVETNEVQDLSEVEEHFKKATSNGEEGVMLKNKSHLWSSTRSKEIIKFKMELEADLLCVGWELGTGKNAERLGALVLTDGTGELKVNVGSGFNDTHRDNIKAEDVVGQIIAVKYNEKIQRNDGSWSLFLPIFIEIRSDKSEPNTLDELA